MYKLIEFLRRIYVAVLFVVFEAIAIGYYAHSSNYTQAKLLTRSNQVVGGVNGIFADIRSYFTLGRENERLLERVAVLEEELAFYRRSAADSVRTDLLHDMGEKPYELTVARVISNSINKNRNFIVLDRGERDGVEKGMGVLSPYVVQCQRQARRRRLFRLDLLGGRRSLPRPHEGIVQICPRYGGGRGGFLRFFAVFSG